MMKIKLYFLIALAWSMRVHAQTGIAVPQMTGADNLIKNFMTTYGIPGLTFAMAKNGKILYMRAFGYSDKAKKVATQPNKFISHSKLFKTNYVYCHHEAYAGWQTEDV